ncbi:uncharacterized protein LOC62_04G006302 [Vanrija pseudolonga]|uniref:Uncharacterized protein n=1 Tax=Vanrija pseudolonga TaxID=143232 RepID=A0AAF0YE31_9TREE|nr:hypothetical protein LOC62_04G006302 [Vanrija pseudolonga]
MRFRRPKLEATKSSAQRPPIPPPKLELAKPVPTMPPPATWGWGRFKARVSAILHRDAPSSTLPAPGSPPGYAIGVLPDEAFFEKVATYEEEYRNVKVFWSIPEFQNPQLWDRGKLCGWEWGLAQGYADCGQQTSELGSVLSTLDWHKDAVETALKTLARYQPDSPSWSVSSSTTDTASFPGSYPWPDEEEEYAPEPEPHVRAAVTDYLNAHYVALSELRDDVSRWQAELLAVVDKV